MTLLMKDGLTDLLRRAVYCICADVQLVFAGTVLRTPGMPAGHVAKSLSCGREGYDNLREFIIPIPVVEPVVDTGKFSFIFLSCFDGIHG